MEKDEALKALEDEILLNPKAGKVIQGTGGLRKMRFAAPVAQRGKSSGFVRQRQTLISYASLHIQHMPLRGDDAKRNFKKRQRGFRQ